MSGIDTLVAIGNSVVWGQGLAHGDKFVSIVHERLAGEPLREENVKARSGAIIGEGEDPDEITADVSRVALHEIPHSAPTILEQVDAFPEPGDPDPATVDLLLLDGGINDTGFETFLDPETSRREIATVALEHSYREMTTLLHAARDTFPNALIVVTGYYPVVTRDTDFDELVDQVEPIADEETDVPVGLAAAVLELYDFFTDTTGDIVRNAVRFHEHQLYQLRRAVADASEDPEVRGPGVLFAHPGFAHENGLFASEPWLFDLENVGDPDVVRERVEGCEAIGAGIACELASTGHPNRVGAERYADAVHDVHSRYRTRSVRDDVSALAAAGDGPVSVREALERYSLDPETGLRTSLSHVIVDCLTARFETGGNALSAGGSDAYLHLAGERWAIQNEDVHEHSTDVFVVDPVLEWDRRLRLREIDGVEFEFDEDFGDEWDLDRLELRINGRRVYQRSFDRELDGEFTVELRYPT